VPGGISWHYVRLCGVEHRIFHSQTIEKHPANGGVFETVEKTSKDTAEQPEDSKGNHSLWQGVKGDRVPLAWFCKNSLYIWLKNVLSL